MTIRAYGNKAYRSFIHRTFCSGTRWCADCQPTETEGVLLLLILMLVCVQRVMSEDCAGRDFRCVDATHYAVCLPRELRSPSWSSDPKGSCPAGTVCDERSPARCSPRPRNKADGPRVARSPRDTSAPPACPGAGRFPALGVCDAFLVCTAGPRGLRARRMTCPAGAVFDRVSRRCTRRTLLPRDPRNALCLLDTDPASTSRQKRSTEQQRQSATSEGLQAAAGDAVYVAQHVAGSADDEPKGSCSVGQTWDASLGQCMLTDERSVGPPFNCHSRGVFADGANPSAYIACEPLITGEGLVARRYWCPLGQRFDAGAQECVTAHKNMERLYRRTKLEPRQEIYYDSVNENPRMSLENEADHDVDRGWADERALEDMGRVQRVLHYPDRPEAASNNEQEWSGGQSEGQTLMRNRDQVGGATENGKRNDNFQGAVEERDLSGIPVGAIFRQDKSSINRKQVGRGFSEYSNKDSQRSIGAQGEFYDSGNVEDGMIEGEFQKSRYYRSDQDEPDVDSGVGLETGTFEEADPLAAMSQSGVHSEASDEKGRTKIYHRNSQLDKWDQSGSVDQYNKNHLVNKVSENKPLKFLHKETYVNNDKVIEKSDDDGQEKSKVAVFEENQGQLSDDDESLLKQLSGMKQRRTVSDTVTNGGGRQERSKQSKSSENRKNEDKHKTRLHSHKEDLLESKHLKEYLSRQDSSERARAGSGEESDREHLLQHISRPMGETSHQDNEVGNPLKPEMKTALKGRHKTEEVPNYSHREAYEDSGAFRNAEAVQSASNHRSKSSSQLPKNNLSNKIVHEISPEGGKTDTIINSGVRHDGQKDIRAESAIDIDKIIREAEQYARIKAQPRKSTAEYLKQKKRFASEKKGSRSDSSDKRKVDKSKVEKTKDKESIDKHSRAVSRMGKNTESLVSSESEHQISDAIERHDSAHVLGDEGTETQRQIRYVPLRDEGLNVFVRNDITSKQKLSKSDAKDHPAHGWGPTKDSGFYQSGYISDGLINTLTRFQRNGRNVVYDVSSVSEGSQNSEHDVPFGASGDENFPEVTGDVQIGGSALARRTDREAGGKHTLITSKDASPQPKVKDSASKINKSPREVSHKTVMVSSIQNDNSENAGQKQNPYIPKLKDKRSADVFQQTLSDVSSGNNVRTFSISGSDEQGLLDGSSIHMLQTKAGSDRESKSLSPRELNVFVGNSPASMLTAPGKNIPSASKSSTFYRSSLSGSQPSGTSEFQCPGSGNYPFPDNPRTYFFCSPIADGTGFTAIPRTCPANQVFDATIRSCVSGATGQRMELRNSQSAGSASSSASQPLEPLENPCSAEGRAANPFDCSAFYLCLPKQAGSEPGFFRIPLRCPSGNIFDPELHQCVEGSAATCTPEYKVLEKLRRRRIRLRAQPMGLAAVRGARSTEDACPRPGRFARAGGGCADYVLCARPGGLGPLLAVPVRCPAGLAFSRQRARCVTPQLAGCRLETAPAS